MKRNLLKVIGISFLVFFVLSWVIPTGTYSSGKLTTASISPVGLVDLFNKPISAFVTFALYGVVFAVIGGFYGVLEKAGILERVTSNFASSFKGRENKFLILTIILFSILSSLSGLIIPLFVLVPLFAATLFKLNYKKVTVLASTVGAIMVGSIGSTLGFNISGYTKNILSLEMDNLIVIRVILLVLLTVLLCITILISSKKDRDKKEVKEAQDNDDKKTIVKKAVNSSSVKKTNNSSSAKKTTNSSKKNVKKTTKKKTNTKNMAISKSVKKVSDKKVKSLVPFWIILVLMFIITVIGMYNWYYSFGIDVFNNLHESIMKVKVSDFEIFKNLLGGVSQLGYWSNIEFSALLIFTSFIIALVYRMSINEYVESFIAGMKKWIPTSIYVCLANVVLVVLYQAMQYGTGTLVETINGTLFGLTDGFNPIITGISAFVGSFFYNDLYYLLSSMSSFTSGFSKADLKVAGVIIQSMYACAMLILPVSTTLIAGLSMFDVKFGKWIKYIWKFALLAILIVMLVCGIFTLM